MQPLHPRVPMDVSLKSKDDPCRSLGCARGSGRRNRVSFFSKKIASAGTFLLEMLVYATFVFAYFWLVLHFLDGWLKHVFDSNRPLYAILSLVLISAQGFLLEILTSALLRIIRRDVI
jgi:hypothetical protein